MIEKTQALLAYELVALTQAADFRGPEKLSRAGKIIYDEIRSVVAFLDRDRPMHPDIEAVVGILQSGKLTQKLSSLLKH